MPQSLARDEAGNVWELDAQGNAVRLHQPAAAPSQTIGTPDPSFQYKAPKAAADVTSTQTSTAKTQAEIPYVAPKAQADIQQTNLQNKKLEQEIAKGPQVTSPQLQQSAQVRAAQNLLDQLDRQEELFRGSFAGAGGLTGKGGFLPQLGEYNPFDPNVQRFNSMSTSELPNVKAFARVPGEGSQSDREAADYKSLLPESGVYDQTNIDRFINLRSQANSILKANGVQPRHSQVFDGQGGIIAPQSSVPGFQVPPFGTDANGGSPPPGTPPIQPQAPQPQTIATQGYAAQPDPALKGVEQQYKQMLFGGASLGDIVGFLQSKGINDPSRLRTVTQQYQFRQKNPSVTPDRYDARDLENKVVPLTGSQQIMGNAAVNPAGSAAINFLDGVTGGWGTTGHKDALAVSQAVNPIPSVIGNLAGGAAASYGLESGAGALGAGAKWAPRLGDLAFGAISGAGNADDGNRLTGAAVGAGAGLFGGGLARRGTKLLGQTVRGVTDPAVQALSGRGIPLTVGQTLGGIPARVENAATSIPIVGDLIRKRYTEGFRQFNRSALDDALSSINATTNGEVGNAGIDAAQDAVSKAYSDALNGVWVSKDLPFRRDMQAINAQAANLPGADRMIGKVGRSFDGQGNMTGQGFQDAVRTLRKDAASFSGKEYGGDYVDLANAGKDAFEGLLDRQAPGVVPAYQAANQAYRRVGIVRDATTAAKGGSASGEGEIFTPSQLLNAASSNARKFDGTQGTTRLPFYDLATAGQNVLPSNVPDSGTAGRLATLAVPGLFGGTGAGAGYATGDTKAGTVSGLGLGAALALGGTKSGQRFLTKALLDRPDLLKAAGNVLVDRASRRAGLFGAPLALQLLPDQ